MIQIDSDAKINSEFCIRYLLSKWWVNEPYLHLNFAHEYLIGFEIYLFNLFAELIIYACFT